MRIIATSAVILHNMIVEEEREAYTSGGTAEQGPFFSDADVSGFTTYPMRPSKIALCSRDCFFVSDYIKVRANHKLLINSLINHHWNALVAEDD